MPDCLIRNAQRIDLPSILSLVKELAEYEKAPEEVWATLNDYEKGFDDQIFEAIVAEVNHQVCGCCIYYMVWSTWKGRMLYLEDFVVRNSIRQMGVGQKLFDAFLDRAKALDCALVKWQVLDWNTPALQFYEKNQAIIEKDWWNGKIILKKKPDLKESR